MASLKPAQPLAGSMATATVTPGRTVRPYEEVIPVAPGGLGVGAHTFHEMGEKVVASRSTFDWNPSGQQAGP
jgi:hypothetical protein